jgi:Tfp pilus assembly protein PilF
VLFRSDQAYGSCHFDLGLNYLKMGSLELAKLALETSVKLSPFSAKYQERLCFVLSKLKSSKLGECDNRLNLLLTETSPQYYLNKYDF